jgi:glutamate formiminotransferase
VVESIVEAARHASSVLIPDHSSDPDHNRMVLTLLGGPDDVRKAVFAAAERAVELIDLRLHTGAHPRIGAIDVVPLVPILGISMEECVKLSRRIGRDIAGRLGVPVYFYETSTILSHRVNLADIRRGGFEHLAADGLVDDRKPDLGPHQVHPTAGAVIVGARTPLIAYNVNLDSQNIEVAQEIARKIRRGEAGLQGVKAMSVRLASRSKVQVSMNVTQPDVTPLREVFRFVQQEARKAGVEVSESEIIGLVRRCHLDSASPEQLRVTSFKQSQILDEWFSHFEPCRPL